MLAYYVKRNFMVGKPHVVFWATGFLNRELEQTQKAEGFGFVRNLTLNHCMSGS